MIDGKFKHPRFKSRKSNDFSYREVMISENCFDFDHRTLNIPKLKKVKFKLRSLPKNFIIKSVRNITVKKLQAESILLRFAAKWNILSQHIGTKAKCPQLAWTGVQRLCS